MAYSDAIKEAQRAFLRATLLGCTRLLLVALSRAEIRFLADSWDASLSFFSTAERKFFSKVLSLLEAERLRR